MARHDSAFAASARGGPWDVACDDDSSGRRTLKMAAVEGAMYRNHIFGQGRTIVRALVIIGPIIVFGIIVLLVQRPS